MICVEFSGNSDNITGFEVSGHGEYDDRPAGLSKEMLALFMQDMMNMAETLYVLLFQLLQLILQTQLNNSLKMI